MTADVVIRCVRCRRTLKREPIRGMGPVCARAAFGIKAPRLKREDRRSNDDRQAVLPLEVTP
jgi:hypothetical protein